MRKQNKFHLQYSSYTALLAIGIFTLLMWLTACATLQKEKGYEHYTKNTDWKIRKL